MKRLAGRKEESVKRTQTETGFSLIELLIVVAIILIIAAIAIPNLMRARMSANDSSAAASVLWISRAEIAYRDTYPTIGFAATLGTLGGASPCTPGVATGCLIDNYLATALAGGTGKSGYFFNAAGSPSAGALINDQFYATGTPMTAQTGTRAYRGGEEAIVRLQPPGTITLVASRVACTLLAPMN